MDDVENEEVQSALSGQDSDNDFALDSGVADFPSNANTEVEEENDVHIFWRKDGSCWQASVPSEAVSGHLQ